MILPSLNPVTEVSEDDPPSWFSKFDQRQLAAALLSVTKWRLTGNFESLQLIDPAPEDPPYHRMVSAAVEIDLLMVAPEAADARAVTEHALAPLMVRWEVLNEVSGDLSMAAGAEALLRGVAHASGGARPFVNMSIFGDAEAADLSSGGSVIFTAPAGAGTLEISAFGQTWTTPATAEGTDGGEGEPSAAAPTNVKLTALEYRTYGGRFSATTGAPA